MKISASIYSSHNNDISALIHELDAHAVDLFHIDCNDDPSVFEDIRKIRSVSKTPIDLHLISPEPEKYYDLILSHGIEYVTLQYESLGQDFQITGSVAPNIGLAVVSETSTEVFKQFSDHCSFVLFMATTPGLSGGTFNKENFRKIRQFRSAHPDKKIHVDGGINEELSFIMRNMGVYAAVVGSYLFKGDYIGSALLKLQSDDIQSRYRISDFMLEKDEIPVIMDNSRPGLLEVLQSIENYRMGFTNIADNEGKLTGIISNADLRRALILKQGKSESIRIDDMINRNPACIREDNTVSELLSYIKSLSFPVLFLPVVDTEGRIKGTIKFNNLIKGES